MAAGVVGAIALVAVMASVAGVWATRTMFDEHRVADAAEAALDEPGVTDALAARLADDAMAAVELESVVDRVLPPALHPLTPAIVGGTHRLVEGELVDLLADPDVRDGLVTVFERSYGAFLDVVRGDGLVDGISVEHGEVSVNFLPLIARGITALQRFGLADDVAVPELAIAGDPAAQRLELEEALGRELPDEFGQVVVYRSESLADAGRSLDRAQQLLVLIRRTLLIVVAVAVLASIGSVALARRRPRAAALLLGALTCTFVLGRAIVGSMLDAVPSAARTPAGQTALDAAARSLTDGLLAAFGTGAVLFACGALVAYALDADGQLRRRVAARVGDPSLTAALANYRSAVGVVAGIAALLVLTVGGVHVVTSLIALALVALAAYAWWASKPASSLAAASPAMVTIHVGDRPADDAPTRPAQDAAVEEQPI